MLESIISLSQIEFLGFFIVIELISAIFASLIMNMYDFPRKKISSNLKNIDNISLAALRGGYNAIVQTVLFDLLLEGNIEIGSGETIKCILRPDEKKSKLHNIIYYSLENQPNIMRLFKDSKTVKMINKHIKGIYWKLELDDFIASSRGKIKACITMIIASLTFICVAGYRIYSEEDTLIFYVLLLSIILLGCILLFFITKPFSEFRITQTGIKMVKKTQKHFKWQLHQNNITYDSFKNGNNIQKNTLKHSKDNSVFYFALYGKRFIKQNAKFDRIYKLINKMPTANRLLGNSYLNNSFLLNTSDYYFAASNTGGMGYAHGVGGGGGPGGGCGGGPGGGCSGGHAGGCGGGCSGGHSGGCGGGCGGN